MLGNCIVAFVKGPGIVLDFLTMAISMVTSGLVYRVMKQVI